MAYMLKAASDYDFLFKLVLIGDTGVGKSCLMTRFADDTFSFDTKTTVGVDFKIKTILVDGKTIKLQIDSFDSVPSWVETVNKTAPVNVSTLLIGNKSDLSAERVVGQASGSACAEKFGVSFLETSARNSTNVQQAFVTMATQIKNRIGNALPVVPEMNDSFRLESTPVNNTYCCSYF
ncbi:ras-related protein Rab-1A-like isoform X2 [Haliotis rubra]|uniref:ras-related protein Rab-1A-like isoform X2 n=1 Tax=Haliotis rubra TaxID=36100 RepID=UPI001EE620B3|nr:ras-related protein Rab-1A-like isoform X2 [Haliotis rubra]